MKQMERTRYEREEYPKYLDNIPLSDKLARMVWRTTSLFLFRPFSLPVFNLWRIFLLKCFGAKLGKGVVIHASAYVPAPWKLTMGIYSTLGPEVKLHFGTTNIGAKVTISQRTYLCSATHDSNSLNIPFRAGQITIEDYVWVAAEAFVRADVVLRKGCIVGARAAVFKDVEPYTIVGGNPAKFIKKRSLKE
jgi:putative colanic acid biosynthesis acetyltransferase WcaF